MSDSFLSSQFKDIQNFSMFHGVVESRNDPARLGRVKVRVIGLHSSRRNSTTETEGIPTDHLPWAQVMMPVTSASISGVGEAPVGIVEGSHVIGYFLDGDMAQSPIIIGTLPGIPTEPARDDGFNDPNKIYPRKDHLNEPDTNRLARGINPESGNESIDEWVDPETHKKYKTKLGEHKTLARRKKDSWDTKGRFALSENQMLFGSDQLWNEPHSPYNARYPFNHVTETESGHVMEFDDTREHERIHLCHRSGTFFEMYPDGKMVRKVYNNNYEIICGDTFILIKDTVEGSAKEPSGDRGNLTINVEGNANIKVDKQCFLEIGGTLQQHIHGDWNVQVDGNMNWSIGSSRSNDKSNGKGAWFIDTTSDYQIHNYGQYTHDVNERIEIDSVLNTEITARHIHLNKDR